MISVHKIVRKKEWTQTESKDNSSAWGLEGPPPAVLISTKQTTQQSMITWVTMMLNMKQQSTLGCTFIIRHLPTIPILETH